MFFGGAGVSTESGIRISAVRTDCTAKVRIPAGANHQPQLLIDNPEIFFQFYREKMLYPDARPNPAHTALAALERRGKLAAVVTQNIDGLHQDAGSRRVLELHGSVRRNYCIQCGGKYGLDAVLHSEGVPRCKCGGMIRPDVVLYEEPLDDETVAAAVRSIAEADMLIVGGTSLRVYPAAGLLRYFQGDELVLVNRDATPYDDAATLVLPAVSAPCSARSGKPAPAVLLVPFPCFLLEPRRRHRGSRGFCRIRSA